MRSISLSLKETDQSYIPKGDVSLAHAINIFNHKVSTVNPSLKINGTALCTLQRKNIMKVQDVGRWLFNDDGTVTIHAHNQIFDKSWTSPARRNWTNINQILHDHLHIDDLLCGSTELAIPKHIRQYQSEKFIRDLVHVSGFNPLMNRDTLCTPVFAFFQSFCVYCIRYSAISTSQFADCAYTLHQLSSALLALSTRSLVILAITTLKPPHISTYNPALHRLYDASASVHLSGHSTS